NKEGLQEQIPLARMKPASKTTHLYVMAMAYGNRYLMVKRGSGGLYGGLWEFPTIELASPCSGEWLKAKMNGQWKIKPEKYSTGRAFRHVLSHKRYVVHPCQGRIGNKTGIRLGGSWVLRERIRTMAISTLTRKVFEGFLQRPI
ncbi:MAG TPA: NUDIX domain-containing protein, partial [Elusimicrobiota bacterium]|nr:NUDIX domain-containing protein [Elusimicrobiota bacterium]